MFFAVFDSSQIHPAAVIPHLLPNGKVPSLSTTLDSYLPFPPRRIASIPDPKDIPLHEYISFYEDLSS